MPPPERLAASIPRAAALGGALVLAVVMAAAGIRLGIDAGWLRPVHRLAASLEVLVMLWLCWKAWRRPAVIVAATLTALLSVVGIVGGQKPPAAIAAVNLLGGLALAATFAWIAGASPLKKHPGVFSAAAAVVVGVQVCLGAWLALVDRWANALPAHGVLALALAALLAWIGARLRGRAGTLLVALAVAAPLAGFTSLQYDSSANAALAHACVAALLIATAVYALGREA